MISQSKSKNSVVKCTPGEACTLGTDREAVLQEDVWVLDGREREEGGEGARNSLPVLERKSRIAEYNRRPISREGKTEREEQREDPRREIGTANEFISPAKKRRNIVTNRGHNRGHPRMKSDPRNRVWS